jgi:hypothetical protein
MPPFGPDPVPALLAFPVALILLAGLSLVGYRALPRDLMPGHAELRIPLATSFGVTLVGLTTWVFGAMVGTTVALVAATVLMTAGLTVAAPWFRDIRRVARHLVALACHSPLLSLLLVGTVGVAIPYLLLPVIDSDGLRYHLALPKLFLLQGKIFFYPWDVHAAFPQTIEALYLLGIRAAGGEVAKFLHFGVFLGSLAVLALYLHRSRSDRRTAVCGPWFLAASPAVLAVAGAAFIDLFVVFHVGVAALLARQRAHPVVTGMALAGAACSKWSAAPAIVGLVVLVWARNRFRIATLASLVLPVVVAVSPFMVRNLIATGDPAYPMAVGVFHQHVPGVDEDRYDYVTQVHRDIPGPLGIPWGSSVGDVQWDEVAGWHLLLGLLVLPLGFRKPGGPELLAVALPYLAVGVAYHPSIRLAMPLLWVLAASAAWLVTHLFRRWSAPVGLALVAPSLVTLSLHLGFLGRPLDRLFARTTVEDVVKARVPGREAALLVNQQPAGGRVMALDFPAPYLFSRPWIAEGINNRPPLAEWSAEGLDADQLMARLRKLDVRYLVVTPGYGGGTPMSLIAVGKTPNQQAVMARLRSHLELIGTRDGVDVYRVPEAPSGD